MGIRESLDVRVPNYTLGFKGGKLDTLGWIFTPAVPFTPEPEQPDLDKPFACMYTQQMDVCVSVEEAAVVRRGGEGLGLGLSGGDEEVDGVQELLDVVRAANSALFDRPSNSHVAHDAPKPLVAVVLLSKCSDERHHRINQR